MNDKFIKPTSKIVQRSITAEKICRMIRERAFILHGLPPKYRNVMKETFIADNNSHIVYSAQIFKDKKHLAVVLLVVPAEAVQTKKKAKKSCG